MQSPTTIRWLVSIGLAGVAIFAASMISLHLIQPELSPRDEAMSFYVHGRHGWLLSLSLMALGAGSLAMALALVLAGSASRVGIALLVVWSVGAVVGGIFSADPPGNWDQPPSIAGATHGVAAMIALASFPVACVALSRGMRRDDRWQMFSRVLGTLAAIVVLSFIAFVASLAPVFARPGPPIWFGLTERISLVAYIAWLAVVAMGLYHISGSSARARPG